MQICRECKHLLCNESFHWKNKAKGKRQTICKACWKQYHKEHYKKNKAKYKERAKAAQKEVADLIKQLKEASPCSDCGQYYPYYVMQYDHISKDKVACIAQMAKLQSKTKVFEEIAKCELVCANCHAERTHNRRSVV